MFNIHRGTRLMRHVKRLEYTYFFKYKCILLRLFVLDSERSFIFGLTVQLYLFSTINKKIKFCVAEKYHFNTVCVA